LGRFFTTPSYEALTDNGDNWHWILTPKPLAPSPDWVALTPDWVALQPGIISTIFECPDCRHWRQFWYKKDGTGWRIQILQWVWIGRDWQIAMETMES